MLLPDPIGRSDEHIVDVGSGHGQVRGHAFSGFVEQRRRGPYPVVQAANNIGALLGQDARDFGKPDVPADQQADAAYGCFKHREAQVAGRKPEFSLFHRWALRYLPISPSGPISTAVLKTLELKAALAEGMQNEQSRPADEVFDEIEVHVRELAKSRG